MDSSHIQQRDIDENIQHNGIVFTLTGQEKEQELLRRDLADGADDGNVFRFDAQDDVRRSLQYRALYGIQSIGDGFLFGIAEPLTRTDVSINSFMVGRLFFD